jgi:Tfp pilus assembly protein PilF
MTRSSRKVRKPAASPATPRKQREPFWTRELLFACVVAIVTAVVFSRTLQHGFITWDDDQNFLANPFYRGLGRTQLRWMWTTTLLGHYVPLSWMTLGFNYVISGMNPAGYHLTNVLLHVINAVLVYALACKLLARATGASNNDVLLGSAVAALLYAIHPLRTESVAWVTERRDVLSQMFLLGTVLMYVRAVGAEKGKAGLLALSVVLFVLSLLSKASGAALPAALLIIDVFPLRRLGGIVGFTGDAARKIYAEKIPYILLAFGAGVLSIVSLPPRAQLPVAGKVAVTGYAMLFYIWKSVLPLALSPLYPMPDRIDAASARFVWSGLAILAITVGVLLYRRRSPSMAAAWLIFVVMTLPLAGVVQNGPQLVADRYTYVGSPALAILIGGLLVTQRHRRTLAAASAAVIIGLSVLTWRQARVWRDSESFWTYVAQRAPESAIAHGSLGDIVAARGESDSAMSEYRRAISLDPRLATAENNLGVVLQRLLRLDEAESHFRRALVIEPGYADAHMNLGIALAARDSQEGAAREFQSALALKPGFAAAEYNWGNALARRGNISEALGHYRAAVYMAPEQREFQFAMMMAEQQLRVPAQRLPR